MTLIELKAKVDALTPAERLELSHYIVHLQLSNDPEYNEEMDRRRRDMDEGKGIALEEVEKILAERSAPVAK